MAYAAIALVAAGSVMRAASSIREGQLQAKSARFNAEQEAAQSETEARLAERRAQVAENDVLAEQQALAFDVQTRQKEFARQFAKRRAAIGAAGLEYTGSSLLVAIDESRQAELDIEAMKWESEQKQAGLRDEAAMQRFQAGELRQRGMMALSIGRTKAASAKQEGTLGAIGAVIGGGAEVASIWPESKGKRKTLMSSGGGGK